MDQLKVEIYIYKNEYISNVDFFPIPEVELVLRGTPAPRELQELTGIDAIIYKIAINPILAAGFMIGTVGLATVVAYWLGGKILPKKEKVEETEPDTGLEAKLEA